MNKPTKIWVWISASVCTLLIMLTVLVLSSNLSDHDLPNVKLEAFSVEHDGNNLHGSIVHAQEQKFIALLVHGDGPQDRFADGGYLPLINVLIERGISVVTWDKAGVAQSTGNWLAQTMAGRASEVAAVVKHMKKDKRFKDTPIGAIGFSQAGWILPQLPQFTNDLSFLVIIGGAINLAEQNIYYTEQKLRRAGASSIEIQEALSQEKLRDIHLINNTSSYQYYLDEEIKAAENEGRPVDPLTQERFNFVQKNYHSDMRNFVADLNIPILVLSGAEDLNVDPKKTIRVLQSALQGRHHLNRFHLIPNATHGLLDARYYNYQLATLWPLWSVARFIYSGRNAYADTALDILTDWIALQE